MLKKTLSVLLRPSAILLVVLVLSILFSNCGKSGNYRWVNYDETQCSDKWGDYRNNEDLKQKIEDYFKAKGISVYDPEIYGTGTPENCLDCYCKTGRIIKMKVRKKDLNDVKNEGFYE